MNSSRTHHETHEPSEAQIQHEAYLLWLEKGRPEGKDVETWLEAKERLKHVIHRASAESKGSAALFMPSSVHFAGAKSNAVAPRQNEKA